MTNFDYLNKENIRKEAEEYFQRDFPQYIKGSQEYNKYFDSYRHTYGSAVLTREYGDIVANSLGQLNEFFNPNNTQESKNQDLWNNKVGREIGSVNNTTNEQIASKVANSLKKGDLITDYSDARKYEYSAPAPSTINNSNLKLTINTDLKQGFANNNISQNGNAIGDADWSATSPINILNGDGFKNTASMGILTDQYRPGNTEISPDLGFADSLQKNIDNLTRMQEWIASASPRNDGSGSNGGNGSGSSSNGANNNLPPIPHYQLQNPAINLTNQAINAKNLINIDKEYLLTKYFECNKIEARHFI